MDMADMMTLDEETEYRRLRDVEETAALTQSPGEFLAGLAIESGRDAAILAKALVTLIEQFEATMRYLTEMRPLPDHIVRTAHNQVCAARLALAAAGFGEENTR